METWYIKSGGVLATTPIDICFVVVFVVVVSALPSFLCFGTLFDDSHE